MVQMRRSILWRGLRLICTISLWSWQSRLRRSIKPPVHQRREPDSPHLPGPGADAATGSRHL
ncbi:MAG TPA: hypothetical protein VF026_04140 [Ktedonobacteraceae bacterium]